MGNRPVYIYTLVDPRNGEVRYVGKTVQSNIRQRLFQHCFASELVGNTHKNNWIKQLLKEGLRPEMEVVALADEHTWEEAEVQAISGLRAAGCQLTNLAEGGRGASGFKPTLASREKMRAANLGERNNLSKLTGSTLTEAAVRRLRGEHIPAIARDLSVDPSTLSYAFRGKNWSQVSIDRDALRAMNDTVGERHHLSALTEADVRLMRSLYDSGWTQHDLAKRFGIVQGTVSNAVLGITWGRIPGRPDPSRARRLKLPDEAIPIIKARIIAGETQRSLATEFGVSFQLISAIIRGKKRRT